MKVLSLADALRRDECTNKGNSRVPAVHRRLTDKVGGAAEIGLRQMRHQQELKMKHKVSEIPSMRTLSKRKTAFPYQRHSQNENPEGFIVSQNAKKQKHNKNKICLIIAMLNGSSWRTLNRFFGKKDRGENDVLLEWNIVQEEMRRKKNGPNDRKGSKISADDTRATKECKDVGWNSSRGVCLAVVKHFT